MRTFRHNFYILAAVLALGASAAASPITYLVTIDTASISGGSGYFMDLQLNPGNPTSQALTGVVSQFNLGAGSLAGSPHVIGDVTGALPGSLTFVNATSLNDYYEGFTAGDSAGFYLTLSGPAIDSPNGTATAGSSFGVFLYDSKNNPVLTVDPGGLLGQVDLSLNGQTTVVSNPASVAGGPSNITFTQQGPPPLTVPEPNTVLLLCSGLVAAATVNRFRPFRPY